MMSKPDFSRLKGSKDYSIWSIRAESFLISQDLITSIIDIYESIDENGNSLPITSLSEPNI